MPAIGGNFNPAAVMLGSSGVNRPYLKVRQDPTGWGGNPPHRAITSGSPAPKPAPFGTLGPQSVRATGTGPFDAAYRENLAVYGGGTSQRPGGNLSFNPTDINTFPGQPTGGGTAPVAGMPNTLLDMALGGQGFQWKPPAQPATAVKPGNFGNLREWMNQFLMNGRGGRMGAFEK